jgi:magnesium chelatase family protein
MSAAARRVLSRGAVDISARYQDWLEIGGGPRDLRAHCRVTAAADALLRTAITRLGLSARAYHRILKIARTIADLDRCAGLEPKHVSEAVQYRSLDRRGVA